MAKHAEREVPAKEKRGKRASKEREKREKRAQEAQETRGKMSHASGVARGRRLKNAPSEHACEVDNSLYMINAAAATLWYRSPRRKDSTRRKQAIDLDWPKLGSSEPTTSHADAHAAT